MNKRDSILTTALELLVEKGVHNTPMSEIAKKAGTGMGTIYNYFPNKEILINEIYINIKKKEETIFTTFSSKISIKTQFEDYYKAVIEFFITNSTYFLFMEQLQASPIITEESKQVGYKAVESFILLLEKGKADKIIKDVDTDELLQFIGGSVLSYLRWFFIQKKNVKGYEMQILMAWDAIKK